MIKLYRKKDYYYQLHMNDKGKEIFSKYNITYDALLKDIKKFRKVKESNE